MAYYLSPIGNNTQTSTSGAPLNAGTINTYAAGTTTPQATYTDNTGGTPQSNPITLNTYGLPSSPIWLKGGLSYKFLIKDSLGNTIRTIDTVTGINDPSGVPVVDQWVVFSGTLTFISATSFSVTGDQTATFQVSRRLQSTNTAGTRYSTITVSSFGAGVTTVTVTNDSGSLDSGLSAMSYGLLSVTNPSIPDTFVKLTGTQTVAGNKTFSGTTALAAVTATDVTTTGNTILGDASTDTLNVGSGGLVKDASGNVQIGGAQVSSSKLTVTNSGNEMHGMRNSGAAAGKSWRIVVDSSNSIEIINNGNSGVSMADGATAWSAFSDERLKDVIEPIAGALGKVAGLRTVIGKYKTDEDGVRRVFLIAQDVEQVLPEAVSESNGYLTVRYTEIIPLLAAAINDLRELVQAQARELATLK